MNGWIGRAAIDSLERPFTIQRARALGNASETDQITRLIEVSMVHRHVGCIRCVLINQCKSAVSKIGARPCAVWLHELGPVILSAANHKVPIRGMQRDALELGGTETRVIEAGPGRTHIRRFPNPAVV